MNAISHVDVKRLEQALAAGIARVLRRRNHINTINVFPVADGDTGTNLAFTLAGVRDVLEHRPGRALPALLGEVAERALDAARGNSGAIMAQYFQGMSEAAGDWQVLDGARLARVTTAGSRAAWQAMSEPVAGTLPTVLEDFADELSGRVADGAEDIRALFSAAFARARRSLAATPGQLAVLREAGVVDAGAQGFVDLLDGIRRYIKSGRVPALPAVTGAHSGTAAPPPEQPAATGYRFCTECLIAAEDIEVDRLRGQLQELALDSLVVAGGRQQVRIHGHTDQPGDLFRVCAAFGEIRQQKADDMRRQHGLMNQRGRVAVVTDSAADLPPEEIDRLGIHVVPVRLNFGDEEFLDKLTITPQAFYRRLAAGGEAPQTSQPPPADFVRQFELLAAHGLEVLAIQISGRLSGTLQAARRAAARPDSGEVEVFDSHNAACGQALMVLWAAEAAARGWERTAIRARLDETRARFRTFALARDLSWGVRGGRVRPWMRSLTARTRLHPVLASSGDGHLVARGVIAGRRHAVARFARFIVRRLAPGRVYRLVISHTDAETDARALRERILAAHPHVDACWLVEASPAVGAHAGPGTLLVGLHPWIAPEPLHA